MTTALFRIEHVRTDDSGEFQTVDALGYAGETLEAIHRVQHHGFASSAPLSSHGIGLRLRGASDLAVALGLEDPASRQKNLPVGAAVLYDSKGNVIRAYTDNGIQIQAAAGGIYLKPQDGQKVFLGGDGKTGSYAAVLTESGPSSVVFARIS